MMIDDETLMTHKEEQRDKQDITTCRSDDSNDFEISSKENNDSYVDPSENDLTVISGAALLTAECMGTGILALPHSMNVLGRPFGLFFLFINLPINFFAGKILSQAASIVEANINEKSNAHEGPYGQEDHLSLKYDDKESMHSDEKAQNQEKLTTEDAMKKSDDSISLNSQNTSDETRNETHQLQSSLSSVKPYDTTIASDDFPIKDRETTIRQANTENEVSNEVYQHDAEKVNTYDFIGMTSAVFGNISTTSTSYFNASNSKMKQSRNNAVLGVTCIYYINIFLVLGNYILVMSHAVAAMIGEENICLPIAGIIACTLMFGLSQLRTMATLGRSASIISLLTLAIVVLQCLSAIQNGHEAYTRGSNNDDNIRDLEQDGDEHQYNYYTTTGVWTSIMRQFAAISSIGFAVGSQKLFLNIRHEFKERDEAPKSLGISLSTFGTIYTLVCILAGSDPPSFLFDAISPGVGRRIAGFLLWVHVAVSYAINSQALCSSIDRLRFHHVTMFQLNQAHRVRWIVLTLLTSISSYMVANAVPFFKDLVALIGSLTSVPLTLLFPALLWRKVMDVSLFRIDLQCREIWSFLLVVFSLAFLVCGVIGSVSSIQLDWQNQKTPFACS